MVPVENSVLILECGGSDPKLTPKTSSVSARPRMAASNYQVVAIRVKPPNGEELLDRNIRSDCRFKEILVSSLVSVCVRVVLNATLRYGSAPFISLQGRDRTHEVTASLPSWQLVQHACKHAHRHRL